MKFLRMSYFFLILTFFSWYLILVNYDNFLGYFIFTASYLAYIALFSLFLHYNYELFKHDYLTITKFNEYRLAIIICFILFITGLVGTFICHFSDKKDLQPLIMGIVGTSFFNLFIIIQLWGAVKNKLDWYRGKIEIKISQ